MVHYRRYRVAGGTYFFTVTLRNRSSNALVQHVDLLRDAFRSVRTERPFTIDAIVILPEHLHTIWTLPEGDADYSGRWRAIKSRFTHELHTTGVSLTRDNRGEYRLWQRRFWEHMIRDERDYAHHIALMHGAITKPSFSAQRVMPSGFNSDRLSFPLVVMPVPVRAA